MIKFWSASDVLLRQLGQERASSIKDYLVDKAKLEDDRVYFIDANLGEARKRRPRGDADASGCRIIGKHCN